MKVLSADCVHALFGSASFAAAQGEMVLMCPRFDNPSGHARSDPIINQGRASDHVHTVRAHHNIMSATPNLHAFCKGTIWTQRLSLLFSCLPLCSFTAPRSSTLTQPTRIFLTPGHSSVRVRSLRTTLSIGWASTFFTLLCKYAFGEKYGLSLHSFLTHATSL